MNLFYLNSHLKIEDKEKILKDFISVEISIAEYYGDEHPAVELHRKLIGIIIDEKNLKKVLTLIYNNSGSEIETIISHLKEKKLINV